MGSYRLSGGLMIGSVVGAILVLAIFPPLALFGVAGFFFGTVWLLVQMQDAPAPPTEADKIGRLVAAFALGAPWVTLLLWFLSVVEDNLWMALPYAGGPAVIVGPFWIVTLIKVARTPSEERLKAARRAGPVSGE